jgi:hypothetical protein
MAARKIEEISATLVKLAKPGMTHKQLLEAARLEHPEASKKEIVRAAFYALTTSADTDLGKAMQLQRFALTERLGTDRADRAGS